MIAWQQANLDTIIPGEIKSFALPNQLIVKFLGIIDPESSDDDQPLNITELLSDSWAASSFSAVNTGLSSYLMDKFLVKNL